MERLQGRFQMIQRGVCLGKIVDSMHVMWWRQVGVGGSWESEASGHLYGVKLVLFAVL